jgi:hypothetical protein
MGDPKDADPSIIEEWGIFDITSFFGCLAPKGQPHGNAMSNTSHVVPRTLPRSHIQQLQRVFFMLG